MVRSFYYVISTLEMVGSKKGNELIDNKIAEAIEGVQKKGATVINSYVALTDFTGGYQFFLLYEDNNNYEMINEYLHNEVFNYGKYLKYKK